jgi:2-polyprenyl-3-methyl-5-hydroxy-6-metoxy-1,4-benzoquinol methylase
LGLLESGGIGEQLCQLGLVDQKRLRLYASRTRDAQVPVLIDEETGIIFIDGCYVGDDEYRSAEDREMPMDGLETTGGGNQDWDTARRIRDFSGVLLDKSLLDFGCGRGEFLLAANALASSVTGIELDDLARESLAKRGITCLDALDKTNQEFEVIAMFHVLEHLPFPLQTLAEIRNHLKTPHGVLIVEVPHARDFLLTELANESFKEFTLWSQHLVLHTRDSLCKTLQLAGFKDVEVRGVQRYGLSNHLTWAQWNLPGGHLGTLAQLETRELRDAYENALSRLDRTDTLIATAKAV